MFSFSLLRAELRVDTHIVERARRPNLCVLKDDAVAPVVARDDEQPRESNGL